MGPSAGCRSMFFLLFSIIVSSSSVLSGCGTSRLCEEERGQLTVFAHVGEDITFNICIKSNGYLPLDEVLPKKRFTTSTSLFHHHCYHNDVNITVYNVQDSDYGPMIFKFRSKPRYSPASRFKYRILLLKKVISESETVVGVAPIPGSKQNFGDICSPLCTGKVFYSMRQHPDLAEGSSPPPFNISQSLTLTCKTEGLSSSSSLSIVKKDSNQPLVTSIVSGSLVYTIESLQCQDMGTYLCLYNKDTSQNVTLDVYVATCMTFIAAGLSGLNYSVFDNISLVCESSDFASSELSISVKDGIHQLKTEIVKNTLVYSLVDLRCSDMATYICQAANDTSYSATLDLPILNCPPQLCLGQDHQDKIVAEEWDNQSLALCVTANEIFFLCGVYRGEMLEEELPQNKYEYSIMKQEEGSLYYDVNLQILNITSDDFGPLSLIFSTNTSVLERLFKVNIHLMKAGFTFEVSTKLGSIFPYHQLDITCEYSDYPASSLSIIMKDRNKTLPTEVVDGTLVYHIDILQCLDMGTYFCLYREDATHNTSLDLPVRFCAPQLCPEENQTRTVTTEVNSDLNISICVIAYDDFFLERVFLDSKDDKQLERKRYKPYIYKSSEITGEGLYHSVDIEMYNITEEDFGRVTFRLRHVSVLGLRLDVEITLQQSTHTRENLHDNEENTANDIPASITSGKPSQSLTTDRPATKRTTVSKSKSSPHEFILLGIFIFFTVGLTVKCVFGLRKRWRKRQRKAEENRARLYNHDDHYEDVIPDHLPTSSQLDEENLEPLYQSV